MGKTNNKYTVTSRYKKTATMDSLPAKLQRNMMRVNK